MAGPAPRWHGARSVPEAVSPTLPAKPSTKEGMTTSGTGLLLPPANWCSIFARPL
jgi:hypothetical protein